MVDPQRLLIIDDGCEVVLKVGEYLRQSGFQCDYRSDRSGILAVIAYDPPQCILLGIGPAANAGYQMLRDIRKQSGVPVFIISSCSDEESLILGLDFGADDCIAAPFSNRLLLAKIRALLRRSHMSPVSLFQGEINLPGLSISKSTRDVRIANRRVALSPREFDLLCYFACNRDQALSRQQLLDDVWSYNEFLGDIRTVDQHVKRLRKKLDSASCPYRISTVWGIGYRFEEGC